MKHLSRLLNVFCLLCLLSGMLSLSPVWTAQAGPVKALPAGLSANEWSQIEDLLAETLPVQQAYLKASNTEWGDGFGLSLAISGDTLVVGAPGEGSNATGVNGDQNNNSALGSGAAYVFTRSGTTWSQQAYLKASNTGVSDEFGRSVAISGDTVVIGAYGEDSNATGVNGNQNDNSAAYSGAAYVFTRSAGIWSQQAYLKASNSGSRDYFSYSVAISGDTLAVGAYGEDSNAAGVNGDQSNNSAEDSGVAYVFTRSAGIWSQQAYLKASNTASGDQLGLSLAISGDTIVVGAHGEDSNATGVNGDQSNNSAAASGATYVFTRSAGIWSQQAYLKASNTGVSDEFGRSLAISGDTLVVGAWQEDSNATGVNGSQADNSATEAGAAYVFARNGTDWSQEAYLKASNTGVWDHFGVSVGIDGSMVVIGAYEEDSSATGVNGDQENNSAYNSGAAYAFTRSGTDWSQQAYLKASNTENEDYFGFASAVSGDTLVVGANGEASNATGVNGDQSDNSALNSGAAYVYVPNNLPTDISLSNSSVDENQPVGAEVGKLSTTDPNAGDTHTYSLACSAPGADDVSFQISGNSLQTNAVFDYETKSSYNICVRTDDGHGGTFDKNFPIHVTDVVEAINTTFRSVGANDGWILESTETSNKGSTMNSAATTLYLGDNAQKKQYRAVLSFSTKDLPDNAVITKVTLKVKKQGIAGGGDPLNTFQGFLVDLKKGFFGSAPSLQASDFQAGADKSYGPFKPALANGWYAINLTPAKAYINKRSTNGGVTQLRLRFKLDDNNNAVANDLSLYSGNAPVASRPQLIIEYYVP